MQEFTYYVEGVGIEIKAVAATQKEAHRIAWQALSEEQKDRAACLDWIDTKEVA